MTDFTQLSDKELSEALDFHRRQRNMSRGLNESAHIRQTQTVRLLEAEEARRLEEAEGAKPSYHYYVTKNDIGPGKKKLTHSKAKPFTTERDAFEHILKSGGRQSGIIHKAHAESGKIVQNRGVDSGQRGYPSSVSGDDPLHVKDLKEEVELDENIKGWKHAGSDISKMRAAAGKGVKLVRLKKDGTENKMHDATKMFRSEDEAQQHHDRMVGLNPKTKISHNLYVDGKHVKKLGEEVELDEAYDAEYVRRAIPALRNAVDFHKEYAAIHDKKSVKGSPEYVRAHSAAANAHRDAAERHKIAHAQLSHGTKDVAYYVNPARELGAHAEKLTNKANALKEEVELDEVSAATLRSYIDKSRADKKAAMKDRTAAEKNVKQYGMASDKKERDDAARRVGNRNQGISVANKKLGTYPADKAKAKVIAREEVEIDESDNVQNLTIQAIQSKLKKAKVSYRDPNAKTAREEDRIAKMLAAKAKMRKEEVEQIDEISDNVKARYLDKAVQKHHDFVNEPWNPDKEPKWATPSGKPKKGYYSQPHMVKANKKYDQRANIIDKTAEKLTGKPHFDRIRTDDKPGLLGNAGAWHRGKKYTQEEVEINEISNTTLQRYKSLASKVIDKSDDSTEIKKRGKGYALASKKLTNRILKNEEVEINEDSDYRVTKVYNKWPKKATYAVHTPDRKYFKEFDSMEAAKAHHDEKTNNK